MCQKVPFSVIVLIASCLFAIESWAETCNPPNGWVQGTDKNTGEKVTILFGNDSQSEITLRDLKDVSVHCEAEYSVQLDFDGYADFRFLAAGSGSSSKSSFNGTVQTVVQKHTTYVHLVSLKETYTGLYTCRGRATQTKNNSISAYIFVPTDRLFVSTRTEKLSLSDSDTLIIPCPLAEPNSTVQLVKLQNKDTVIPINAAVYDARQGFSLPVLTSTSEDEQESQEGTYFCIANHGEIIRVAEYVAINGTVECDKKCGENSQCELVNDKQVCQCKASYQQTLLSEKCLQLCKTDSDCSNNMACLPQDTDSFLLDLLTESRRRSTDDNQKEGTCKNPCIFTKTNCLNEGSCRVVDNKATCISRN